MPKSKSLWGSASATNARSQPCNARSSRTAAGKTQSHSLPSAARRWRCAPAPLQPSLCLRFTFSIADHRPKHIYLCAVEIVSLRIAGAYIDNSAGESFKHSFFDMLGVLAESVIAVGNPTGKNSVI
jgi:hypothetical protein